MTALGRVLSLALLLPLASAASGCDTGETPPPLDGRFEVSLEGDRTGTFDGTVTATRQDFLGSGDTPATTRYEATLLSDDERFFAQVTLRVPLDDGLQERSYRVRPVPGTVDPGEAIGSLSVSDAQQPGRAYATTGSITITSVSGDAVQARLSLDGSASQEGEPLAIRVDGRLGAVFVIP